jgi:hypothetical protein
MCLFVTCRQVDNVGQGKFASQPIFVGVQTTIEKIAADGAAVRATVRFEYPSQDFSIIEFLLTESNGLWKITDEVY